MQRSVLVNKKKKALAGTVDQFSDKKLNVDILRY